MFLSYFRDNVHGVNLTADRWRCCTVRWRLQKDLLTCPQELSCSLSLSLTLSVMWNYCLHLWGDSTPVCLIQCDVCRVCVMIYNVCVCWCAVIAISLWSAHCHSLNHSENKCWRCSARTLHFVYTHHLLFISQDYIQWFTVYL